MDYTCENCINRHTWECDDGWQCQKCDSFELDELTLSESEKEMLRVIRQVVREKGVHE